MCFEKFEKRVKMCKEETVHSTHIFATYVLHKDYHRIEPYGTNTGTVPVPYLKITKSSF